MSEAKRILRAMGESEKDTPNTGLSYPEDYWTNRRSLSSTEITDPEQIANLPWHGNHASDSGLFKAVDQYILSEPDREKQKRALFLSGLHGMGIEDPVDDADFEEWLLDQKYQSQDSDY